MSQTAVALINSTAIRHNFLLLKQRAKGCRVMPVLKANAYGHGMVQVAHLLPEADAFAVARVGEGIKLRSAGISQRVVVLGGCIDQVELVQALEHRLDLVIHHESQLVLLAEYVGGSKMTVWVKVDSGMGRLGVSPSALSGVLSVLNDSPVVAAIECVMTHLACADQATNEMTLRQLDCFNKALEAANSTGFAKYKGGVSVANSAGMLQWPQTLHSSKKMKYTGSNWVRPGISLYGVSPMEGRSPAEFGLIPAMTFRTRLIAVKRLKAGETVGYGAGWLARKDSIIGIAAVGYGDGYPRGIAASTAVFVRGQRAPLVGAVSMDMVAIDLSDAPDAGIGDIVELWGENLPVHEIAAAADTIAYELLTQLSGRPLRELV